MTTTRTYTFNRDDVFRVYASFAADYRIVAEWTELHRKAFVDETIQQIRVLAEKQFLLRVHLHLRSSTGAIRDAAVYRVSTNASGWSSDRPGDLYWDTYKGDRLRIIVDFSKKWWDLSPTERHRLSAIYMPGWGTSEFDGDYGTMVRNGNRRYASRAYGMERTCYQASP